MTTTQIDVADLTRRVQDMYEAVATDPDADYHFELGRALAERLGYPPDQLDQIPGGAVESFAGVGYFFDLAQITTGESVLDLGSGSGMDSFLAALAVGDTGRVVGVDMTPAQLDKASRLRTHHRVGNAEFRAARIEELPFPDSSFDVVISNGVINLAPDKQQVFAEAARVLRPGGRLAIADIVTETALVDEIVCNVELWAACIGGAAQQDAYQDAIETAGLQMEVGKRNAYQFRSDSAQGATTTYGVKSVSLLARKPN